MANRFLDSCQYYNSSQVTRKWSANADVVVDATNGRDGGPALRITAASNDLSNHFRRTFDNQATWIVGWRYKATGFPNSTPKSSLLALLDGGTQQVSVMLATDGTLRVYRGTTLLATSLQSLTVNELAYIEFKTTIHNTTGSYELRVNGVTWLSATNINTRNTANAYAAEVAFGNFYNTSGVKYGYFCDIYISDGTGTANNDFWGDTQVNAYLPNGDGTYSQLTRSAGTQNYTNVDENPANDDTDYNQSATVGNKDSYAMANIASTTLAVKSVQANSVIRNAEPGTKAFKHLLRSGGSDYLSASKTVDYSAYRNEFHIYETDPNTGVAWTKAGFDAVESGIEVA